MKKGFTMIELVFVIVILGILASIAVPRLAATRDDANAVKAAAEIKDVITQLGAKYIADKWSTNIADDSPTYKTVSERTDENTNWTNCVAVEATDGAIKITKKENISDTYKTYCNAVLATPAVKEWVEISTPKAEGTTATGIVIGGSGIYNNK
ncbi:putative type II secretion system protein [Campylobacter iguaniorum]|uniref:type II secretion system protein n=1 Tax=Campylobacter iguaniorum TaxID=1244531 RepID=UPI00073A2863|nr:type II secretion system protein [Campylobacter iguaniorum]ALV23995.1 putative type II secretion system protein [Campylobacter iguaniorum]